MKRLMTHGLAAILLLVAISVRSQDFTVTIASTDPYQNLCKPVKAGATFNLTVSVKCNSGGPFTVSINRLHSFKTLDSWFSIENNSQVVNTGGTVNFYLTVAPPLGTGEAEYSFPLYFDAYKNNVNNPFNQNQFIVIVDNTPPAEPEVRVEYKTSTTMNIYFSSSDARSAQYTQANQSSGVNGIKSYLLVLKNPDGSVKATKPYNATETTNYHTFSSLSPNTNYTVFVTAEDLASNSKSNAGLQTLMPPSAPVSFTASSPNFCSITLSWSASAGATSYLVCNTTEDPTDIRTTTSTSYTFTGLDAETSYSFWVMGRSSGGDSDKSTKAATSRTIPAVTGSTNVCASNSTYYLNNLPKGWSVSWSKSSNLTYVTGQNTTSYIVRALDEYTSDEGWVQATIIGTCPTKNSVKSFWVGKPSFFIESEETLEFLSPGIAIIDHSNNDPYSFQSVSQIDWSYTGPLTNFAGDLYKATFRAGSTAGQGYIYANAFNTCGATEKQFFYQVVQSLSMSISPNPSSNHIDVLVADTDAQENNVYDPEYSVAIVDLYGKVVYRGAHKGSTFRINIGNLTKGLHSISVERNGNSCSESFIKE